MKQKIYEFKLPGGGMVKVVVKQGNGNGHADVKKGRQLQGRYIGLLRGASALTYTRARKIRANKGTRKAIAYLRQQGARA